MRRDAGTPKSTHVPKANSSRSPNLILAYLGDQLGDPWGILGGLWEALGALWDHRGTPGSPWGGTRGRLGGLGETLGAFGRPCGVLKETLGGLKVFCGPCPPPSWKGLGRLRLYFYISKTMSRKHKQIDEANPSRNPYVILADSEVIDFKMPRGNPGGTKRNQ